ncbi:MAG: DUF4330 domain-containing protein [Clostridia bacterium]
MIIDNKGRLFGRVNLLDLLFVVLLIVAIAAAYVLFSGRGRAAETIPVTYTLEIQNRDAAYFEHVNEGEQVTDGVTKAYMGEITGFSKKPAQVITQADDKLVSAHPAGKFDGYVEIKAEATVEYPDMLLGKEALKIGKAVALRSESLAMRGYIVDIDYDFDQLRGMK